MSFFLSAEMEVHRQLWSTGIAWNFYLMGGDA